MLPLAVRMSDPPSVAPQTEINLPELYIPIHSGVLTTRLLVEPEVAVQPMTQVVTVQRERPPAGGLGFEGKPLSRSDRSPNSGSAGC